MNISYRTAANAEAGALLTVDVNAVVRNWRTLARRVAPATCGAVVKADCYGLGASRIAQALLAAGCSGFFVATLAEGLTLRRNLGHAPRLRIYVLNGLPPGTEQSCAAAGLIPVLNTLQQCRAWVQGPGGPAVLQVDTGMSRLGLSVQEQQALCADAKLFNALQLVLIMSHLAAADDPSAPLNNAQLQAFRQARTRFPTLPASLANSAGCFLPRPFHFDLCRPGAALYGLSAGPLTEGIEPVAALHAPVIQLRDIAAGDGVGYGHTYIAPQAMRLAVVPVGYADGWPRHLSNTGGVWFGDRLLPIVGRVSMDSFMVDATSAPDLIEGAMVELIGPHQTADDIAAAASTIGYEILTRLGARYLRRYKQSSERA